jgi:hypothetical protein
VIPATIRRDDAWRSFPVWGVVLILNTGLFIGLMTTTALRRHGQVSPVSLLLLGWLTLAFHLGISAGRARCRPLDLALPISARRLFVAHVSAIVLSGTVLVAACVGLAALPSQSVGGTDVRCPGLAGIGILLEGGLLLGAALLQLPRPTLARVSASPRHVAWTVLVLSGVLPLLMALRGAGPLGTFVPLLLAAVVFAAAFSAVPRAYVAVPRDPERATRRAGRSDAEGRSSAAAGAPGRVPWGTRLAAFRCVTAGAKELIVYALLVAFGLFLGGAFAVSKAAADLRDLQFVYVPLAAYLLFSMMLPRLALLQDLDPLPISRRLLFAGLLLPSALAYAAAWGAGAAVAAHFGDRVEYVDFAKDDSGGGWSVSAPLRVHRIAWDGRVPDVTSPWGESHPADRHPLIRGWRPAVWSPFSAPPGSSARFVALQIGRAAEAVYGLSIPPEEIERRWLVTFPDGSVAGRGPSLGLREEHPGAIPRSGPEMPVLLALAMAPWLLLVAALFRAYRSSRPNSSRQAVYWGGLGLLISPLLLLFLAMIAGLARPWLARALLEIPMWSLQGIPGGTAAAWVGGAVLLLAAYRLAEIQFLRAEIPARPVKYSLLERMREES